MSNHTLKQLQTRKAKLEAELARLVVEQRDANVACSEVRAKLNQVNKQIESFCKEPVVSEHAVLRYLERVLGLDIEGIRKAILCDDVVKAINTLGDGDFPIGCENGKAIVRGKVVVSVR